MQTFSDTVAVNKFWRVSKIGQWTYAARRTDGLERVYFNREALERDFGPLTFPGERLDVDYKRALKMLGVCHE